MRWPRRRWAVTQYYYGIANNVVVRCWTEAGAKRAANRRRLWAYARHAETVYTYRVAPREPW